MLGPRKSLRLSAKSLAAALAATSAEEDSAIDGLLLAMDTPSSATGEDNDLPVELPDAPDANSTGSPVPSDGPQIPTVMVCNSS